MRNTMLILMIGLLTQVALADSMRVDVGYYTASSWWKGEYGTHFSQMPGAVSDDAETATTYQKLTFDKTLSKRTNLTLFVEHTSSKIKDLAAAASTDGETISGISGVGFSLSHGLNSSWSVNYGVTSPGNNTLNNAAEFVGINDGQVRYHVGVDYTKSMSKGRLDAGLSYIYRAGHYNGTTKAYEVPDMLNFSLAYYRYLNTKTFLFGGVNMIKSLGGIDVGTTDWADVKPNFAVVEENRDEVFLGWGKFMSKDKSIDITYNQVISGRNTDKGQSINVGFTKHW
jgi:hypothetical protein